MWSECRACFARLLYDALRFKFSSMDKKAVYRELEEGESYSNDATDEDLLNSFDLPWHYL